MSNVKIGHASISERGTVNGEKGDSTKREVCTRDWYDKEWDFMAIHPDSTVREKHAKAIEAACANNNIGYGQNTRNTLYPLAKAAKYDLSKITEKCNCDCSSLQNVCAVASGANGVTYGSNGWTTSNMKTKLKAAGYVIIEKSEYLKSADYCVRGAIYVKAGSHTVCGLTNGSKASKTLSAAGVSSCSTTAKATYFDKCAYTGTSITEALKSIGVENSKEYRKKIAKANSITGYTGTAAQNTKMLNLLKKGKLIKP